MRGRGVRAGWLLAAVTGTVVALGLTAAVLLVLAGHLPALLVAAAARVLPGHRVTIGDARLDGLRGLDVRHLRVRAPDGTLLVAVKRLRTRFAPWALVGGRLEELHLVDPLVLVSAAEGATDGAPRPGAPPGGWSVGRLVVRDGRAAVRPGPDGLGATFRFAADLQELGLDGERGGRRHRLRVRALRAGGAAEAPAVVLDDALLVVRPAALVEERRVDEVRLFGLAVTLPPLAGAGGGGDATPAFAGRIDRLVARGARLAVQGDAQQPAVALTAAVDLRDVGLDGPLGERRHRARFRDLRMTLGAHPPSLVVDRGQVEFALADVLDRGRIARLLLDGGSLRIDRTLRAHLMAPAEVGPPAPAGTAGSLGVLEIRGLQLRIADLAPGVPDVTLAFQTTLQEVPLGAEALAAARDPQRVELADLRLYSPLDPFRQVVRVGHVFIDFTIADVLHQHIEALTILSPTIYVGEDLVWYMRMAGRQEAADGDGRVPPWTVGRASAALGKIVVTFNGLDRLSLPITFQTTARNVALENVAALRLSAALEVPRQSYTFPGFDLELRDMEGKLYFHYPPGEARDNVVNVLQVREMRWRDYRITEGWLAVTFDEQGINGKLGGSAYEGYVDGGMSVPFAGGVPWAGWLAGTALDLAPIAQVLVGDGVQMTGVADVRGTAHLLAGERLERAEAELTLAGPGAVRLPALDALLERLPADASPLQRDLARIVVEAFRDYRYDAGRGRLAYADARGRAALTLEGPRGGRRLEVRYTGAGARP